MFNALLVNRLFLGKMNYFEKWVAIWTVSHCNKEEEEGDGDNIPIGITMIRIRMINPPPTTNLHFILDLHILLLTRFAP